MTLLVSLLTLSFNLYNLLSLLFFKLHRYLHRNICLNICIAEKFHLLIYKFGKYIFYIASVCLRLESARVFSLLLMYFLFNSINASIHLKFDEQYRDDYSYHRKRITAHDSNMKIKQNAITLNISNKLINLLYYEGLIM